MRIAVWFAEHIITYIGRSKQGKCCWFELQRRTCVCLYVNCQSICYTVSRFDTRWRPAHTLLTHSLTGCELGRNRNRLGMRFWWHGLLMRVYGSLINISLILICKEKCKNSAERRMKMKKVEKLLAWWRIFFSRYLAGKYGSNYE